MSCMKLKYEFADRFHSPNACVVKADKSVTKTVCPILAAYSKNK